MPLGFRINPQPGPLRIRPLLYITDWLRTHQGPAFFAGEEFDVGLNVLVEGDARRWESGGVLFFEIAPGATASVGIFVNSGTHCLETPSMQIGNDQRGRTLAGFFFGLSGPTGFAQIRDWRAESPVLDGESIPISQFHLPAWTASPYSQEFVPRPSFLVDVDRQGRAPTAGMIDTSPGSFYGACR